MVIARAQRRTRDAAIRLSTVDSLTGLFNRTLLLRGDGPRDRPERPLGARLLPADDGSRRAQGDQRPARSFHRRPGAARRRRRSSPRASARSTRRRATAATNSSSSCPRPIRPARTSWPRRSGSGVNAMPIDLPANAPRPSLSIGVVAYPDDGRTARRADHQRGRRDVRLEARRQGPGDRRPGARKEAARDSGVASPRERRRHRPPTTPAHGPPRLLDPRHPRGLAGPEARPDPDERPDLPDRDVRLGGRRRARRASSAIRVAATPTAASPTRPRPRSGSAYAELAGG